ncbi:hypothetical protein Cob_v002406 [Colletotrichum orbiculare MAFF 240422]|uniref:Uncharacterized protein n=1 Tax=Colletotrichum orbiculare (strain 104-T / ATCC 96160 / CBS 514.97 / LARS 414 / MAFF 240422) TaxID=1213857 RepID=A0A484G4Q8_COLOR|nr:hypothetical protein Cob_v002406 [Colletotrichum orbiculare MAFF 240422]
MLGHHHFRPASLIRAMEFGTYTFTPSVAVTASSGLRPNSRCEAKCPGRTKPQPLLQKIAMLSASREPDDKS